MADRDGGRRTRFPTALPISIAGAFFALEWATSFHPSYGYFIDELYYIACAKHLAFGYVDHPPLAPALLALNRAILGDALPALRLLPALCAAGTAFVAMRSAWRLGGDAFAQGLSGLCVAGAIMFYGIFSIFSTNCFEVLCWTVALAALIEQSATGNGRGWWLAGLFVGLAVLSKHTSVALAGAIGLGVLLPPARTALRQRDPWIGAAILLLVVAPNLVWEIANDWVSLEFYAAGTREGNVPTPRLEVFAEQVGTFNPATFPVWAAGFWFLLFSERGRPYRHVGWTCALLFIALIAAALSRPDRIMGIYPTLFAAGAVQLEGALARPGLRWLRVALPVLVLAIGVAVAPVLVPILSPETTARYTSALGEENEIQREVGQAKLLIALAHRMGSRELVETLSQVHAELAPEEQQSAIFLTEGYPSAGAIELFGGPELPPAYSPHNNYYLWGPPPEVHGPVITVGFEADQLEPWFEDVEVVARNPCELCMGWRQNMPIAIARRPRRSLRDGWPELRRFGNTIRKRYLLGKQQGKLDP
jgi:hypothetical protein